MKYVDYIYFKKVIINALNFLSFRNKAVFTFFGVAEVKELLQRTQFKDITKGTFQPVIVEKNPNEFFNSQHEKIFNRKD